MATSNGVMRSRRPTVSHGSSSLQAPPRRRKQKSGRVARLRKPGKAVSKVVRNKLSELGDDALEETRSTMHQAERQLRHLMPMRTVRTLLIGVSFVALGVGVVVGANWIRSR
jgi:hypothetical protein